MKNRFVKIIVLVAIIIALLCFAGCNASYAQWELSKNEITLSETYRYNTDYFHITTLVGYDLSGTQIRYRQSIYLEDSNKRYTVYSPDYGADIVYLYNSADKIIHVFAKDGKGEGITSFIQGNAAYTKFVTSDLDEAKDIGTVERNNLDGLTASAVFDVPSLADKLVYKVIVYDNTATLSHVHGGVYKVNGMYYYVNYDNLDNSYFNADGSFSYRFGQITAAELDSSFYNLFAADGFVNYDHFDYEYEEGIVDPADVEELAFVGRIWLSIYIAVFAIVPCIVALAFMIADIVRRGFYKVNFTTYVISGASIVGILSAVAMILLL